jgi:ElaA protein
MITWQWLKFEQLSCTALYTALALRSEVFVIEQTCIYQDIDGLDPACWHLLGWQELDGAPQLVAYLRGLPPGLKFTQASLGRVITQSEVRGTGVGRALLNEGLLRMQTQFPEHPIRIAAQCHLQGFYQDFGFVACSERYDEDGIPHIDMLRAGTVR